MATGKRDANYQPVWMGVSSADGVTPLPVKVDPATGRMLCLDNTLIHVGGNVPPTIGKRDPNRKVVRMGEVSGTSVPAPIKVSTINEVMLQAN